MNRFSWVLEKIADRAAGAVIALLAGLCALIFTILDWKTNPRDEIARDYDAAMREYRASRRA